MKFLGSQIEEGITLDWYIEDDIILVAASKKWMLGKQSASIRNMINVSAMYELRPDCAFLPDSGRIKKEMVEKEIMDIAKCQINSSFTRLIRKIDIEQQKRDKDLEYDAKSAACDIEEYRYLLVKKEVC